MRAPQRIWHLEPGLVADFMFSACSSLRILYWTKRRCTILRSNDSNVRSRCAVAIYYLQQSHPHARRFGIEPKPVSRRTALHRLPLSFMVYLTRHFSTIFCAHFGSSVNHRASLSPIIAHQTCRHQTTTLPPSACHPNQDCAHSQGATQI